MPGQSLESVELLANPFAAEYGRFSTSVVQLRTRRGTNDWEIKPGNLMPRFRGGFTGIRGFEPRFSVRGPIKRDRLFIAQDVQFRYVNDPVKSLPDEPEIGLTSFDSFTRIDGVLSPRHTLGGLIVLFPRRIEHLTMNTFRPPEVTPEFNQSGASVGLQDRFAISPNDGAREHGRGPMFEVDVNTDGRQPMIYTPATQQGSFFNDQDRDVRSVQWVEALSFTLDNWRGRTCSSSDSIFRTPSTTARAPAGRSRSGASTARSPSASCPAAARPRKSRPPSSPCSPRIAGASAHGSRWSSGARMDREDVIERVNWSPRGGVSVGVLPEGRGILRGGIGRFRQRTPLNVGAFGDFESASGDTVWTGRSAARSAGDARERPVTRPAHAEGGRREHRVESAIRPARAVQGELPETQRIEFEYILEPDRHAARSDSDQHGHVEILGARSHRPVSRRRAPRPHRLLRAVARARPI